jgi:spermidine synthase
MANKAKLSLRQTPGKLIYRTSDEFGIILVLDYPRYRVLSFDSMYEQSGFYVEKPYELVHEYTRIMLLALGFITPKHITILGLGGGSLLRSLHYYLDDCEFHAVELRQQVFEIARDYFDTPTDDRIRVSIADAQTQLVANADCSTDIIFSDIYDAADMSSIQVQKEFLVECERTLSKQGWLVINYHTLPDRHSAFFKTLQDLFPSIIICAGEFNSHVLFASKSHRTLSDISNEKITHLETILGGDFLSLIDRLEYLPA